MKKLAHIGLFLFIQYALLSPMILYAGESSKVEHHVIQGENYELSSQYESAILEYKKALEVEPKNTRALNRLANAYIALSRLDDALEVLLVSERNDPAVAETHLGIASVLIMVGREEDALQYKETGMTLADEYALLHPEDWKAHADLGGAYLLIEQFENAVSEFERALMLNPDSAEILAVLSISYTSMGNGEQAVREAEKVLALYPQFDGGYLASGFGNLVLGNTEDAKETLEEALRLNPKNFMAHFLIGPLYLIQGETDLAIDSLREAVRLVPEYKLAQDALKKIDPSARFNFQKYLIGFAIFIVLYLGWHKIRK